MSVNTFGVPKTNTQTDNAPPPLAGTLRKEMGYPTGMFGMVGWPDDPSEPNDQLRWPQSVKVYDAMRRDSKVAELLSAVTMPIRRAAWHLDPNGATDEVVQFVASNCDLPILDDKTPRKHERARDRFSFRDHMRISLLDQVYGHMMFEQVVDADVLKKTGAARLRKLGARFPQSIFEIFTARDGGLVSIRQHPGPVGGPQLLSSMPLSTYETPIPVSNLVAYSRDREGAAWQGNSLLRAAWKPWMLKQEALGVHAVTTRRNGMGIPDYEAPLNAPDHIIEQGLAYAQSLRAGETAGGARPAGGRMRLLGVEGSLPDTLGWIHLLDEAIASVAVAEFLKLGSSSSGSRALGNVLVDVFNWNLGACADDHADTFTAHVIEDLVDWNFGETVPAPRLVHSDIGQDPFALSQALQALTSASLLTPDDTTEDFIRDTMSLPPRKITDLPRPGLTAVPPIAPAPVTDPNLPAVTPAAAARGHRTRSPRSAGPRTATDPERAAGTDFTTHDAMWQDAVDKVMAAWQAVRSAQVDALMAQVQRALAADDLDKIAEIVAPAIGGPVLYAAMVDLSALAAEEAVVEAAQQNVVIDEADVSARIAELRDRLEQRANATDQLLSASITATAIRAAFTVVGRPWEAAAAHVEQKLLDLSDARVQDLLGGALTVAQNTGRIETLALGPPATWYASELLDGATCENCAEVDGTTYDNVGDAQNDYPSGGYHDCQGGDRCRGTLVAVYSSETDPTVGLPEDDAARAQREITPATAQDLKDRAIAGGFTFDPRTGTQVEVGYVVAVPGASDITPTDKFTVSTIEAWIDKHHESITANPNLYMGGWRDEKHDEIVLDRVEVLHDRETAIRVGTERGEQAIWDLANSAPIETGGTGGRDEILNNSNNSKP